MTRRVYREEGSKMSCAFNFEIDHEGRSGGKMTVALRDPRPPISCVDVAFHLRFCAFFFFFSSFLCLFFFLFFFPLIIFSSTNSSVISRRVKREWVSERRLWTRPDYETTDALSTFVHVFVCLEDNMTERKGGHEREWKRDEDNQSVLFVSSFPLFGLLFCPLWLFLFSSYYIGWRESTLS